MPTKYLYKISSKPGVIFEWWHEAYDEASIACRRLGEPQVLMTIRPTGALLSWEIISTYRTFFRRQAILVTVVDYPT